MKRTARLTLSALVLLTAWTLLAWIAARWLIVSKPLVRADAIVMLSGSATFRERAEHAAKLYQEGRSPRVILTNDNLRSGWSSAQQRNPYFYERALDDLLARGVPRQDIEVLATPVTSTYDEAALLREYSERHGLHSLLIVTSAYHSRRALWTFRYVFGESAIVVGLEPANTGAQSPRPLIWWLSLLGWRTVATEYPKLVIYWFRLR